MAIERRYSAVQPAKLSKGEKARKEGRQKMEEGVEKEKKRLKTKAFVKICIQFFIFNWSFSSTVLTIVKYHIASLFLMLCVQQVFFYYIKLCSQAVSQSVKCQKTVKDVDHSFLKSSGTSSNSHIREREPGNPHK